MQILLDDRQLLDDLASFLRNCGYESEPIGPRLLSSVPGGEAISQPLLILQIEGYLRTWMRLHPGTHAELIAA
jgi:hypothetical protein